MNGLFPLAMEGLVQYYAGSLHGRKVILHCNVLWMTSPKADLSDKKKQDFNHAAAGAPILTADSLLRGRHLRTPQRLSNATWASSAG